MVEKWKDIIGYENYYKISNYGKIKNKKNNIILKPSLNKGYYRITLHKNGAVKSFYVHRLVALNFIENKNKLPFINHKDENKINNYVNNLEWCDRKYNNSYGTRSIRAGIKCRKKVDKYDLKGNYIKTYNSMLEAKKENSKSSGTHISECCKGNRKSAYGFIWKYHN